MMFSYREHIQAKLVCQHDLFHQVIDPGMCRRNITGERILASVRESINAYFHTGRKNNVVTPVFSSLQRRIITAIKYLFWLLKTNSTLFVHNPYHSFYSGC